MSRADDLELQARQEGSPLGSETGKTGFREKRRVCLGLGLGDSGSNHQRTQDVLGREEGEASYLLKQGQLAGGAKGCRVQGADPGPPWISLACWLWLQIPTAAWFCTTALCRSLPAVQGPDPASPPGVPSSVPARAVLPLSLQRPPCLALPTEVPGADPSVSPQSLQTLSSLPRTLATRARHT